MLFILLKQALLIVYLSLAPSSYYCSPARRSAAIIISSSVPGEETYFDAKLNATIRKLHIQRLSGFDGKTHVIQVAATSNRSDEDPSAITNNSSSIDQSNDVSAIINRNRRLISAHGLPRKDVQSTHNSKITRIPVIIVNDDGEINKGLSRAQRSAAAAAAAVDDLQADESKVFRPLFVYRQQQANRQRINNARNKNKNNVKKYDKPKKPNNNYY